MNQKTTGKSYSITFFTQGQRKGVREIYEYSRTRDVLNKTF